MSKPMISVVMISYNHQEFIEYSLMSVIKQQNANYDLEILIVDDGSNDNTQAIITDIQSQYPDLIFPTFKKHVGITAINKNLNEQMKKARGEYIAFLAGDDQYLSNRFVNQLKLFDSNEKIQVVISDGRNFDINKKEFLNRCQELEIVHMLKGDKIKEIYEYIVSRVPRLLLQGYLMKSTLLKEINYFDEDIIADDWVLNIKMFKYLYENDLQALYLEEDSFKHNIHLLNTSRNIKHQYPRVIQVIKKYSPKEIRKDLLARQYISGAFSSLKKGYLIDFIKYCILVVPSFHKVLFILINRGKK